MIRAEICLVEAWLANVTIWEKRLGTSPPDVAMAVAERYKQALVCRRPLGQQDSSSHEGLAALLRADGDPIRHGTTQNMRHGIRLVCGIEFQPGALDVLCEQALAFQAATCIGCTVPETVYMR
jgi:hypothetical protein